jgi:ATP synthase protein I
VSGEDDLLRKLRLLAERHRRWLREGDPSFGRQLARAGVLGWIIVVPMLLGVFIGRWIDRRLGSGIFWTAPLLLVGAVVGCRTGWRWIHRQ